MVMDMVEWIVSLLLFDELLAELTEFSLTPMSINYTRTEYVQKFEYLF